jgi:hypothetical protein
VVSFKPLPFYPRKWAPGTNFIGGWVDPRAGLDDMEKWKFFILPGLEIPPLLVVQPIASRYTDWAIAAPRTQYITSKFRYASTILSSANIKDAHHCHLSDKANSLNWMLFSVVFKRPQLRLQVTVPPFEMSQTTCVLSYRLHVSNKKLWEELMACDILSFDTKRTAKKRIY